MFDPKCVLHQKKELPRKGEGVCTCCWNATDELLQKVATALVRNYAVAIYQHAVVGELTEAAQCRAALANLKFLEPHRPASLRREFEKVKDMRPLDLGTYIKGIYQSTQPIHLTEHGRAAKKFMLDKVFSSLAVRSATEVERAIIFKLQDLIVADGLDMHAVQLATSVAVGKVSQNKVAMGILEGAMMKLEDPRKGNSLQGRLRRTSDFVKERLRHTALTVASKHCSNKLKDMLGIMKSPGVLQDRMVRVPSCFAALEDEERMRECALAIRSLSPEGSSFVLTSDATCLAAGVLPCSAKWSPIESPVMLGGVWHWSGDCTPIIKSRMDDTGEWSP